MKTTQSALAQAAMLAVRDKVSRDDYLQHAARLFDEEAARGDGIKEVLRRAGKGWFYLDRDYERSPDGRYFLNPQDQHIHNFGWFTEEELLQWAEDKGPVMKRARP